MNIDYTCDYTCDYTRNYLRDLSVYYENKIRYLKIQFGKEDPRKYRMIAKELLTNTKPMYFYGKYEHMQAMLIFHIDELNKINEKILYDINTKHTTELIDKYKLSENFEQTWKMIGGIKEIGKIIKQYYYFGVV